LLLDHNISYSIQIHHFKYTKGHLFIVGVCSCFASSFCVYVVINWMGQRVAMYCGNFRFIRYSIHTKTIAFDRGCTSFNRKCLCR